MSKYRSIALTAVITILVFAILGFAEVKQDALKVTDITITIDDQYENYFIAESDVLQILNEGQALKGAEYNSLNLKNLETRLEENRFVQDAEIYRDLKGGLSVNVLQNRPIARIIRNDGPDAYINFEGSILPVSDRFTARLPLISGEMTDELIENGLEDEKAKQLLSILEFIMEDPFWKAQIAQMDIDKNWDIEIYPQVTKQLIEFGQPDDLERKFRNLEIFYKRILPQKGWNSYSRVSVKYKNQIICE